MATAAPQMTLLSSVRPSTDDLTVQQIMHAAKVALGADKLKSGINLQPGTCVSQHVFPSFHEQQVKAYMDALKQNNAPTENLGDVIINIFKEKGIPVPSKALLTMFLDGILFPTVTGSEHARFAYWHVFGGDVYRHPRADRGVAEPTRGTKRKSGPTCQFCNHQGKFMQIRHTDGARCVGCESTVKCMNCAHNRINQEGEDWCDDCLSREE